MDTTFMFSQILALKEVLLANRDMFKVIYNQRGRSNTHAIALILYNSQWGYKNVLKRLEKEILATSAGFSREDNSYTGCMAHLAERIRRKTEDVILTMKENGLENFSLADDIFHAFLEKEEFSRKVGCYLQEQLSNLIRENLDEPRNWRITEPEE